MTNKYILCSDLMCKDLSDFDWSGLQWSGPTKECSKEGQPVSAIDGLGKSRLVLLSDRTKYLLQHKFLKKVMLVPTENPLHMRLCSLRPVRVPMLTRAHY